MNSFEQMSLHIYTSITEESFRTEIPRSKNVFICNFDRYYPNAICKSVAILYFCKLESTFHNFTITVLFNNLIFPNLTGFSEYL